MDLRKGCTFTPEEKHKKGDTAQLAAQLAPLEEQDRRGATTQLTAEQVSNKLREDPHFGEIVVDNENLHVTQGIMEGGDEKTYLGMEPVVLVILGVMLAFIAFIAWQITLMPVE